MIRTFIKYFTILVIFGVIAGLSAFFTMSWIVKGEDTVIVPELVGKDAIGVLEFLTDLGLNIKVHGSEYHKTIPKNHILHQKPEPGERIKKGRDIALIISKGTQQMTLPDLAGRNLAQARITLEENGLLIGSCATVFHHGVKYDGVIAQNPLPGTIINRGNRVDLLVSAGKRPDAYEMPDLQGAYLDEAVLVLEKHKIFLDGATTVYDKSKPVNTVISQAPPAGYYVEEFRGVNLTINRNPDDGNRAGTDKARFFVYRIPPGFLKQQIRLEFNGYGLSVPLYDELMAPGRQIWAIIPRHAEAALFLYRNDELVETELYD